MAADPMSDPISTPTSYEPGSEKLVIPGLPIHGTWNVTCTYTNWRGESAKRRIGVMSIWFGPTSWHPEPQWLMHGLDLDKLEVRDFALRDMRDVTYGA